MEFFLIFFCALILLVILGILVVSCNFCSIHVNIVETQESFMNIRIFRFQGLVIIYATTSDTFAVIERFPDEKYYIDPTKQNTKCLFPYLEQKSSIDLSVIVPAYNEEERCKYGINVVIYQSRIGKAARLPKTNALDCTVQVLNHSFSISSVSLHGYRL